MRVAVQETQNIALASAKQMRTLALRIIGYQHEKFKASGREPMNVHAELVFNLACPASPIHYQHDPYTMFTTSVNGAQRIIEMARGRKCTIVHASTSEVYGDPTVHPQDESYWGYVNPIGPRACYDEGKRGAETLLMDAKRSWNIAARIVRIFNTYGPRMAFNDGRVVSNFITQALRDQDLTIYGGGKQTRSFCYVDDLVDGLFRVGIRGDFGGPMNLGNPIEFSMLGLAELTLELTGKKREIIFLPMPTDDPKQRMPDISLAANLIHFERAPSTSNTCARASMAMFVGASVFLVGASVVFVSPRSI